MPKQDMPYFKFYPGDYWKFTALRRCSPAARALWTDLRALMWESEDPGVLSTGGVPLSDREIAEALPGDTAAILTALSELVRNGVVPKNKSGAYFDPDLVKQNDISTKRRKAGAMGGNPNLVKQNASKSQANGKARVNQNPEHEYEHIKTAKNSNTEQKETTNAPRQENEEFQLSAEPFVSPPVLLFLVDGKEQEWRLTELKLKEYQESFPSLDVLQQLRVARQWCIDNPTNRKTARGMPAFLTNWLSNAQNKRPRGVNALLEQTTPGRFRTTEHKSQLAALEQRAVAPEPPPDVSRADSAEGENGNGPGIPY